MALILFFFLSSLTFFVKKRRTNLIKEWQKSTFSLNKRKKKKDFNLFLKSDWNKRRFLSYFDVVVLTIDFYGASLLHMHLHIGGSSVHNMFFMYELPMRFFLIIFFEISGIVGLLKYGPRQTYAKIIFKIFESFSFILLHLLQDYFSVFLCFRLLSPQNCFKFFL